ncbi:MAG: hypothetical protein RSD40_01190 [Bacilli bacterium]
MYKRFNLKLDQKSTQNDLYVNSNSITQFKENFKRDKSDLCSKVSEKFSADTALDGSEITKEWFPQENWDVFISHSHNDKDLAIHLAAWLQRTFDLKVFVDSFIWGSADELLIAIDNEYCVLREEKNNVTYNYDKRNFSTSHVHMMLSGALSDVIYNTECIIFLNTPNSININGLEDKETNSPWIYNEIKITSIVEKHYPREFVCKENAILENFNYNQAKKRNLEIGYKITEELNEFKKLTLQDLIKWKEECNNKIHPLDHLYFNLEDEN